MKKTLPASTGAAPRVRPARLSDAPVIAEFNWLLAKETEDRELDRRRLGQGVRAVLRDVSKGRYFVAELQGRVVGQLLVTQEWSDWRNGMFWWLQSVYVAKEARGRGVFRALFRAVIERSRRRRSVCGIRLYMEEENHRARGAYLRLGLKETHYRVFESDFRA